MAIKISGITVIGDDRTLQNVSGGSGVVFDPKVLSFDPVPLSSGIATTTNITITFDQQIQFSGLGTIYIRESSPTGTISTYFTCGVSTEATIAGETLIIDPKNGLGFGTTYYVTFPSVGIANTYGTYYKGTESYLFQTTPNLFSADGGDDVFTAVAPSSPTGYYKYHIFTSSGILTTYGPSVGANDLSAIVVGGGGGGGGASVALPTPVVPTARSGGGGAGGLLEFTGPTLALNAGTYTITIGAGGAALNPGNDTTIDSPTSPAFIRSYGGGAGGDMVPSTSGNGSPGGSGGGGSYATGYSGSLGGIAVTGQGFPGGTSAPPTAGNGGGGGGAGSAGGPFVNIYGGIGLAFPQFSDTILSPHSASIPVESLVAIGFSGYYGGGGGAANSGIGGTGGGGSYNAPSSISPAINGYTNTGGGGAGGVANPAPAFSNTGSGGSGVIMIRYASPGP